jgi:mono/diheme cytochrome c family protein
MVRAEVPVLEDSVIKRISLLRKPGALCIGLSAACLALACGNEEKPTDTEPEVTVQPPDVVPGDDDECTTNPYIEDCGDATPPDGPDGPDGPAPPEPRPAEDLPRAQAQNILLTNCGGCHGTQLTEEAARAGMNYINDMVALEANGQIVALESEASPIIKRMRDGSMPPGGPRVPGADIDFVASFIDEAINWPGASKRTCNDNPALDFNELYETVAGDLRAEEARDQPFLRYISLDNRAAAGVCTDTALDLERQAVTKLLNSLSTDASVVRPDVVNPEQTLFRFDLRDLKWDREVVVNGETFPDVWEAILDANQYAVPFIGDAADDARADAQTDVPVMFLDAMLDVAAIGNLYYAIIDVDVNQSLDDFVAIDLGIDVVANLDNEDVIRAGTTKSRISRQDRLIEGHDIDVRSGVYYQSFDFDDAQNESIFQDPFGFNEGGREAIFTLPNGMFGYLIADENGALVEDSNILLDANQNNFRAVTSVSCASCHARGLLTVEDEVRDVVLRNAIILVQDGTLDQEQLEALEQVYLEPEAFKRRVESDSSTFYLNALNQANLPISGSEPVSTVFLRFDQDMTLKDAASVLGLSDAELDDTLGLLDPALGVLRNGTIDRDDFTALYLESLCILSLANENRPDDALCADLLGD